MAKYAYNKLTDYKIDTEQVHFKFKNERKAFVFETDDAFAIGELLRFY